MMEQGPHVEATGGLTTEMSIVEGEITADGANDEIEENTLLSC